MDTLTISPPNNFSTSPNSFDPPNLHNSTFTAALQRIAASPLRLLNTIPQEIQKTLRESIPHEVNS